MTYPEAILYSVAVITIGCLIGWGTWLLHLRSPSYRQHELTKIAGSR